MTDFMKLQNGSDIRGVAMEGIPGQEVNLTETEAGAIAGAFAYWLGFKVGKNPFDLRICVGQDSRLSGDTLKEGVLRGIAMFGAEGYDAGLASTPAMFMSTVLPQMDFDGAVMITASHLPWNRNGFKFFTKEGGLDSEDIASILRTASKYNFVGEFYEERHSNALQMYAAYLRQMISVGLKDVPGGLSGMHIVVDAGNGAGGFFARDVLEPMGADISGSQFLDPDGTFPNHSPNPENREAIRSVCKAVTENKADLGIIFDTDVDRIAAVGPDGKAIARNRIIALAAAIAADDYPGGTVVTDSLTSVELHEFLEKNLGLKHLRYKRGYRNVINKEVDDYFQIMMRFDNGVTATLELGTYFLSDKMHDKWFERHWFLGGNKGSAYVDGFGPEGKIVRTAGLLQNVGGKRTMTAAGPTRSFGPPPEGKILTEELPKVDTNHRNYFENYVKAWHGEEEFLVKIPETRRVLRLMDAVRESGRTGKSIDFE